MRVHILAKELNVPSKVIVEKCKAEGIDSVKNHMSTLSAGLLATIREWFSEGAHETTVETADPVDLSKVRKKTRPRKKKTADKETGKDETSAPPTETAVAVAEPQPPGGEEPSVPPSVAAETPSTAVAEAPAETQEGTSIETETTAVADVSTAGLPESPAEDKEATAERETTPTLELPPPIEAEEPPPPKEPIKPAGPQNVPAKAKLQGPRVVRYEAPEADTFRPRPRREMGGPEPGPGGPAPDRLRTSPRRRGRISPRRTAGRVADAGERVAEWRDRDLAERRERLAGATGRRIRRRSTQTGGGPGVHAPERKTKATVTEPVRMKDFCAATGLNFIECFKVLRDEHDLIANVNMTIPSETAELLALHFGIELTVIPAKTKLDELQDEVAARERKHLQPRPPVVTMLGHVDHGKTSLLDAIRKTHVVATEDGGITQHIGAYHVISSHGPVTFLDTPGHEAFTAMRARGAELTDVVVLVVAADDGVMPQTVEAINHAKAADVPIVVALNKIDLGDQNKIKIYTQLTEHGLTPSGEWGGDVDVIPTSATTGQGVQELVDHLADLASLLELKADPTLPAVGTAIEAETKPGVGPVVRVLVQEGTLRVGDVVVCGPAAGKVRALLNDRGERIREAGPAIPVEVWGLDDVPMAGDRLYVVENMKRAKDIATETKQDRLEKARAQSRKVRTLEEMLKRRDAEDVPELNVIIKADVDGSVAALKQSLGDFPTDEVKLTIRHAGVGAVTDSDVDLAAACDGIILAFRVDAPAGVRRLAEHHGVDIRTYRVIYDVCDDVKKALEGMLAPEEVLETRGTAEVRELFRMSKKVGLVAGCYVTDGVVNRNHLVKIVRDGVVVREGCAIASLRRFKDDVKEVRAGLECGIKLDGFDDLHVGDVLEAYEIVQVARTL